MNRFFDCKLIVGIWLSEPSPPGTMNVLGGFKRMKSHFGGLKGGSSSSMFCFGIPPIKKRTQLWGLPRTGGCRPLNNSASLYFFRWFGSIGIKYVQTTCLEVNTSECPSRNPDFGLFWMIWEISWLKWVEDLETKGGRLKKFTFLETWGPRSSSIVDRDRRKANVVGSRDGETRGMLATIIARLTHWPLTNVCHRHIASTSGSNHGVSETGEQTQLLSLKEIERRSATACNCVRPCVAVWHSKLRYLQMLYHAGVHPPFGFLSSTKARQRNAQSARTLH